MDFLELVNLRKSCRDYSPKPVERERIERCIEAARLAPSACNSQPWRFIVIENEQLKTRLQSEAFCGIYKPLSKFVEKAPILVAIVREPSKYSAQLGGFLRGIQYSLIDIGIAGEHFVLQAAQEGLGTCWIGWFNERKAKKILGVKVREKIDAIISLGYPSNPSPTDKNRKTLSQISEFR